MFIFPASVGVVLSLERPPGGGLFKPPPDLVLRREELKNPISGQLVE